MQKVIMGKFEVPPSNSQWQVSRKAKFGLGVPNSTPSRPYSTVSLQDNQCKYNKYNAIPLAPIYKSV